MEIAFILLAASSFVVGVAVRSLITRRAGLIVLAVGVSALAVALGLFWLLAAGHGSMGVTLTAVVALPLICLALTAAPFGIGAACFRR